MRARAIKNTANTGGVTLDERLDQVILWITLAVLITLPLSFSYFDVVSIFNEPKVVSLHLAAGLISTLWIWQIVLRRLNTRQLPDNDFNWDLMSWAGRNPARWALIGAVVWVSAQVASTILSPLPVISFFGGDEARSGYNLYDSLSMSIIMFSVALRFRTKRSLDLLIYTLVATGAIAAAYGIAQHFGWDPIGGNAGRSRIIASFGNTLNFGGYMVMSIPATLALAYKKYDRKWLWLAGITLILGLQVAGIWFSGGRGPYVSIVASLITFFVMSMAIGTFRQTAKGLAVFAAASLVAVIFVLLPSEKADIGVARALSIGQLDTDTTSTDIEAGLAGRLNIWGDTLKLATSWDVPIDEPTANRILRPVFGLGPDIFVYSFPIVGKPQTKLAIVDHPHNYELMVLMEQGFVGLAGFIALTSLLGVATFAIARRVRKSASRGNNPAAFLILALLPANMGKLVELQTGVGRVSDLGMTLALFGAVIAVYEIVNHQLNKDDSEQPQETAGKRSSVGVTAPNQAVLGSALLAAIVVPVVFISIFFSWDVRRLSASRTLALGWDAPTILERALMWDKIQSEAPERESFTFSLFEQYLKAAKEQHDAGNPEEGLRLLNVGRNMLLEYEKRDPFELDTQIGLSKTASQLMVWGHNEYAQELADRAINLAESNLAYPTILGTSATALTSVGLHDLAIVYADKAIATEASTRPWAKAWYAKGRALYELGFEDEAIDTLLTSTAKDPGAEGAILAHQVLAQIYESRGEIELSKKHEELGGGKITIQE